MKFGAILAVFLSIFAVSAGAADFPSRVVVKVGFPAGGSFDVAGRLVAAHLGQFLPGNPDVAVENVAGAGGARMFRNLIEVEPANGQTVGLLNLSMSANYVLNPSKAGFDPRGVQWIGALVKKNTLCLASKTGKVKSLDDNGLTFGSMSKNTGFYWLAAAAIGVKGTNSHIVVGYKSELELIAALRRGEIDAFCGLSYSSYVRDKLAENTKIIGAIGSADMLKSLNAPEIEQGLSQQDRLALGLLTSGSKLMYDFGLPPKTPPAIVEAYRSAFAKMIEDPGFVAEARKDFAEYGPSDGKTLQQFADSIYATDPNVVARANELIK